MEIRSYQNEEIAIKNMGNTLLNLIEDVIDETGNCIMAISGGSTPIPLYEYLSNKLSQFENLLITQVDERFVPANDPKSNQKMINEYISDDFTYFIPTPDQVETLEEAANKYSEKLKQLFEQHDKDQLDIILLGVGSDGHTASLFPDNPIFVQNLDTKNRVVGVKEEKLDEDRISLTPYLINQTPNKFLLFFGKGKANALDRAIKEKTTQLPISHFLDDLIIYSDDKTSELIGNSYESS